MPNPEDETTHQQPLFEISDPDPLALRQVQYRELDRLMNSWQLAGGRESDDGPPLDVDAVIRRARLALYDGTHSPYEIMLLILAELFRAPGDGTLELLEAVE